MLTEFYKSLVFFICNSSCESVVFQFNLPTGFAMRVVTMHTLVYSSHADYDKDNDITNPKANTSAPWSHRSPLEHNLEPDCKLLYLYLNETHWYGPSFMC